MGKLVIKYQGDWVGEASLKLGETTIGRNPASDIVLGDKSVSSEHALIKTVGARSTIEDLGSTNGTYIGTERIERHELKHGDTIVIGEHSLVYRDDPNLEAPAFGKRPSAPAVPAVTQEKTRILNAFAQLLGVEGKHKGARVPLVQDTVVIENPGKNPARIYRTGDGYVLHAQVGPGEPRLNDRPVPPGGQLLENGDIVEVAGTKYQVFK
jgi:hypothetical protein